MQENKDIENVVQEIMGLLIVLEENVELLSRSSQYYGSVVASRNAIKSKLRELAENSFSVQEPLSDEEIEKATGVKQGTPMFLAATGFVRATERAHGITNTSEEE